MKSTNQKRPEMGKIAPNTLKTGISEKRSYFKITYSAGFDPVSFFSESLKQN